MLCSTVLIGSRLIRAAELLLKTRLTGNTLENRVRWLDTRAVAPAQIAQWLDDEAEKRHISLSAATRDRLIALAFRGKQRLRYWQNRKNDAGIVLAHFSPCGFHQPRRNLLRVLNQLVASDYPIAVVEAIMPNAEPLPALPKNVVHKRIWATLKNTLFLKESLFNIGANLLPQPKLFFLDADIEFNRRDWLPAASALLDAHDILQPFSNAVWLNKDNTAQVTDKKCAAYCLQHKKLFNVNQYHPGFAWGFRRDFFDALGGWYARRPIGGGDISLLYALSADLFDRHPQQQISGHLFLRAPSFLSYMRNAQTLKPRITYLERNAAFHLWHGKWENRKYTSREAAYLKNDQIDCQTTIDEDGLLAWQCELDAINCLSYFRSRSEDS
jgi:hypothetical protein